MLWPTASDSPGYTQVVYDPSAYLEDVKRSLAQKSGIEPGSRCLIFRPCDGVAPVVAHVLLHTDDQQTPKETTAQDVLLESRGWQAILFQNDRALGRLVSPQLWVSSVHAAHLCRDSSRDIEFRDVESAAQSPTQDRQNRTTSAVSSSEASAALCAQASSASSISTPVPASDQGVSSNGRFMMASCGDRIVHRHTTASAKEDTETACAAPGLLLHRLTFNKWQPVWTEFRKPDAKPPALHIPVDAAWRASQYRVEVIPCAFAVSTYITSTYTCTCALVIGRGEGGAFALPGLYMLSGALSAAAISQDAQRRQYVLGHQRSRSASGAAAAADTPLPELSYENGSDLRGLEALFNVSERPAWLKAIVLKFALVSHLSQSRRPQHMDSTLSDVKLPDPYCRATQHKSTARAFDQSAQAASTRVANKSSALPHIPDAHSHATVPPSSRHTLQDKKNTSPPLKKPQEEQSQPLCFSRKDRSSKRRQRQQVDSISHSTTVAPAATAVAVHHHSMSACAAQPSVQAPLMTCADTTTGDDSRQGNSGGSGGDPAGSDGDDSGEEAGDWAHSNGGIGGGGGGSGGGGSGDEDGDDHHRKGHRPDLLGGKVQNQCASVEATA